MEEWKQVLGYQNYQVSNYGRVKSIVDNFGRKRDRILSQGISHRKGKNRMYNKCFVVLYKDKKRKTCIVSRLVYQAFKGKIKDGYQIDHIDNNPQNNRLDNLQCLSPKQNVHKVYVDNPSYISELEIKHPKKKIICNETSVVYNSIRECSRIMNIPSNSICYVLSGQYTNTHGYTFRQFK